jgi:hypothetical protein
LESAAPALPRNATAAKSLVTERPGTIIGPYKLLQQIGEGGMGVVYMAEPSNWIPKGPAPIRNSQTPGSDAVSGRISALAADPIGANTIYIAAAGGE